MTILEPAQHPIAIVQMMINFAASYGLSSDLCLADTGITAALLIEPEALITREQEMKLVSNLIRALPDVSALGFKLGLKYNVSIFGLWGFALRTSRNLREAAQFAIQYLPLSTAYCSVSSFESDSLFGVQMDSSHIPEHLRQFLLERDMATGLNLFNELNLARYSIANLEFEGPAPSYAEELSELAGYDIKFESKNLVAVDKAIVDQPLPTFDASLVRLLETQCQQQLQHRQATGLEERVRQQLLGPLGLVASLEEVADKLALSTRSLRRKLEQAGTSFRALVEEERKELSVQLLVSTELTIEEIAIHVGYGDSASFTRAFRRWLQCSPGEYRKNASDFG